MTQRGRTASGAPLTNSVSPATTDARRRRGSNGKRRTTGSAAASAATSTPSRRASASIAASIGSPWATQRPSRRTARPDRAASRCPADAQQPRQHVRRDIDGRGRVVAGCRRCRRCRSASRPAITAISLRVSVPVLSVQMNVVEPRVSTDSSRRTRAWRRGHPLRAHRQRQRHGRQQPLGHERDRHADREQEPVRRRGADGDAMPKNATPTPTAMSATTRTTRSSSWASGLRGRCAGLGQLGDGGQTGFWRRSPRRPLPPRPRRRTCRPAARSPSLAGTAALSPVSIDVSIVNACASTTRRSADTRSPALSTTRSPTTSSAASISCRTPVADHHRPPRQQIAKALGGALGPGLLDEGEHAVDDDHDEDRDAELRHAGDERQDRRPPTA